MKKAFVYIKDRVKRNKWSLLLLYFPLHTIWYEIVRILSAEGDVWLVSSPLDEKIPFVEWFVIPYCVWYFYIAAVLIYLFIKEDRGFLRGTATVVLCMALPMLFCTVVPNGLPDFLRPDLDSLGRNNAAIWMVRLIYSADSPPRCVMPSMHCSVAVALFYALFRAETLRGRRVLKLCSGVLSLLIVLSTVFIKQHSVLDLFAGIALALAVIAVTEIAGVVIRNRKGNR